jgi:hypothetical protein
MSKQQVSSGLEDYGIGNVAWRAAWPPHNRQAIDIAELFG